MDNENEDVQAEQEIVAQEESVEEELDLDSGDYVPEEEDDSISISKSEFSKLKRKAIAYDSTKTAKPTPNRVDTSDKDDRFERLELRADGYSKDEIDEIMSLGGTKVLDTKIVQSAIKYMRADAKSKNASEPVSSRSPVYKKFTQEDLSKMSSAEMEKILQE